MQCRRCHKDLPEGSGLSCPFCGIRQDTYIIPHGNAGRQKRKKSNKGALLSMVSVGLVVAIVCVLIPMLREHNKNAKFAEIKQICESGDLSRGDVLSAKIATLKKSYPSDTELHDELDRMLNEFLGLDENFDPNAPSVPPDADRESEVQRMIETARESVLDVTEIALSGPTYAGGYSVALKWVNSSVATVSELRITLEAYDAAGNAVQCTKREKSEGYIRMTKIVSPGQESEGAALDVWFAENIQYVQILNL